MYLVMVVKTSMTVRSAYGDVEVPFTDAGFVGMIPVFATQEEAEEWADGKFEVVPVMEKI